MARTAVPVNGLVRTGVTSVAPVAADVANGNSVANNGRTFIEVTNSDTVVHNLTIQPTTLVDGQTVVPVTHAIPANQALPIKYGPFSTADYSSTLEINGDNAMLKFAAYAM